MFRFAVWALLLVAVLNLVSLRPVLGTRAAPSVMMFYGGALRARAFIVQRTTGDLDRYAAFWCGLSTPVEPAQVAPRPYMNVGVFWLDSAWRDPDSAQALLPTLKPEDAHQHGRLYAPSEDGKIRAAVVSTDYMRMTPKDGVFVPMVRPVPADTSGFKYGCWLNRADMVIARDLGLPGFDGTVAANSH